MSSKPSAIVSVLYPRIPDLKFNLDYYLTSHVPLTFKLLQPHGLLNGSVSEVVGDSDYAYNITLEFKDVQSWEKGLESGGKELTDDFKNFTNATPVFVVGKVVS
ncbi:hypothetical protein BDV96DRAFT_648508 [Lophiotrema nucula]|uniref:EthD domain-containing protein n=1 Tax=Lophiotrema nucula TaxID=690887 RepID=A0A6A5Z1D4_9PLEO|nr:hypothetical protein BDV96DRAFT_648508 [Lophiotrema nucula]